MRKQSRTVGWVLPAVMVLGAATFAQKQTMAFVTVVAPATGPVANLEAKEFSVNGGKVQVADAAHATEPLSVEILVDVSRPQQLDATYPTQDVRTALQAFVQAIRAAEPGARIGVMQVGGAAVPVADLGAPAAAVDKAVGSMAAGPDMSGAVIVEAVQDAAHKLSNEPAPRRAIVSVDFASVDTIVDTRVDSVVKDVFKTGASLWAISLRSATAQPPIARENALNSIAKNNGGQRTSINAASGLKDQLMITANSLLSQYELTMSGIDASKVHDLKITTSAGAKVFPSVFARPR